MKTNYLLASLCSLLVACSCVPSRGVDPDSPITAAVQEGIESGTATYSHDDLDDLLRAHVKDSGRVDYQGLGREREKLKKVLTGYSSADLSSLSRDELLAFFINAYNAYTLDLILEHYPVESIKDIDDPWDTPRCLIAGHTLSLNDIEHRILRPEELFDDPRMHFAINCASVGCPLLRPEAYVGTRIDAQLEDSVKRCLTDRRYARLEGGEVRVTRILSWFEGDFVEKHGSLEAFLKPYATDEVRAVLEESGGDKIGFLPYDWSLNDTTTSSP